MSKKYLGGYLVANTTSIQSQSGDPQFNQVALLLHGDGTNGAQNNTFLDSSTNNFTITRNGNTTQGSFSPYGSLWSNYLGGAGNYFTVPSTLSLGSSNYTIEFWFCGSQFEMTWGTTGGYAPIVINNSGDVYFADSANTAWDYNVNGFIIKTNTWHHYALVRISSNVYIYRDGVRLGSYTQAAGNTTNGNVVIGLYTSGTTGYISNFRCVIGTGVYTEAFTPPTAPLTAITNTVLLVCQSNKFVDNSTNNYALTITGTSSVQRFSPFNPPTAYSTSVIGGSGYFDGSGDYLGVASNAGFTFGTSTDFTIEMWVNTSSTANMCLIDARPSGTATPWALYTTATTGFPYFYDGTSYTSSVALTLNAWNHVAVSRSAGTLKLFVNGVQGYSAANTSNLTSGALQIGGAFSGAYFTGYISDIRIVNGTGIYTAAFTPPTTPLTAVTNTKLLLNCTNAGIYDNAMMNDLETVGSAQVSTSVVKFGTGSMSFDGSSSYLQGPVNPSYAFSTGNFTIEFWVYVTSYTATATTVVRTAGTSGWVCQFDGTNKMIFYANGTAQLTDSASPSTGTWTYFAVVRSGSTLTMYRNGTSVASTTYATAINPTGVLLVGCGGDSNNAAYGLNGYIDDLRITKGYARTITTPTTAFPDTYSATASVVPTATSAPGIWTLEQAAYYKNLGLWPTPP